MAIKFDYILGKVRLNDELILPDNRFFASNTARDAAITSPKEGEFCAVLVSGQTYYILQEYVSNTWLDRIQIARGPAGAKGDKGDQGDSGMTPQHQATITSLNGLSSGEIPVKGTGDDYEASSITETTDEVRFSKRAIFQANSANVGDSRISSGGNTLILQNDSTSQRAYPIVQKFNDSSFTKPSVFDESQQLEEIEIQLDDSVNAADTTAINFNQTLDRSLQLMFAQLRPVTLPVTENFKYVVRLASNAEPIYDEIVTPSMLTGVDPETVEFKVVNASQFLNGQTAYITIEDIALKGVNNITGSPLQGDPSKNNFFPWLKTRSIPLVNQDIATEEYVTSELNSKEDSLGNPASNGQILSSTAAGVRSWIDENNTDSNAIHDNIANEISAINEKTTANDNDLIIIEDSEDSGNKKRMKRSTFIGNQSYHSPVLENFSVDIASRVDLNTDLNVSHTFNWTSHNSANLSSLLIQVTSGTNQTITLPITDGSNSATFTLSGIDTSSAGTVTFQLTGTDSQGTNVTSNLITINIANAQTHQQTHFGSILSTEDQTDIDFSTDDIEARENAVGSWVVSGLPGTGLHRIYFAVPVSDNIITRIAQSGFTIYDSALTNGNQFTLINNISIGGFNYNILLMNAGSAVNSSYNGQTLVTS